MKHKPEIAKLLSAEIYLSIWREILHFWRWYVQPLLTSGKHDNRVVHLFHLITTWSGMNAPIVVSPRGQETCSSVHLHRKRYMKKQKAVPECAIPAVTSVWLTGNALLFETGHIKTFIGRPRFIITIS
jgi:hypothetical protein